LSDPSDYSVAADGTIEVQPLETLGHYGDWLEIKTQRLRDLNGLAFRTPVDVGQRIRLDLGTVDAKAFELLHCVSTMFLSGYSASTIRKSTCTTCSQAPKCRSRS
jgi:hypothetical protein